MQNDIGNELMQCPYERSHHILRKRFQIHLGRCRNNHKEVPKVVCPFNVTHVLNAPELDWHVTTCPERQSFENFKHRDVAYDKTKEIFATEPVLFEPAESTETWEDEIDVPSYNPQTNIENAAVLRGLKGATPSERKRFRKEERLRLLNINNKN